jgi:predicted Zn-dependent protease
VHVLYGAALAQWSLRDLSQSQVFMQRLLPLVNRDAKALRLVHLLRAELAYKSENMAESLKALASIPPTTLLTRPELLAQVQALTRQGASPALDTALTPLRTWLQKHPDDGQAWQVLAAGWMAQGRALQSLRAEGEAQWARQDLSGAVDRFKAAQDVSRKLPLQGADLIEASIVDARLRSVQTLWREQLLER